MHEHKDHIKTYNAADIRRYLEGKLSAAEMHAMEKAALDDPFLADAMDGMAGALQEHEEPVISGHLQQLQQQLQARTAAAGGGATVRTFRWWQAAAAAVVLITVGIWGYKELTPSGSESVLAKQEKQAPLSDSTIAPPPATITPGNNAPAAAIKEKAEQHYESNENASPTKPNTVPVTIPDLKKPETNNRQDEAVADALAKKTEGIVTRDSLPPPVAARNATARKYTQPAMEEVVIVRDPNAYKSRAANEADKEDQPKLQGKITGSNLDNSNIFNNLVSGRVTGENNMPLPNAFLRVENNKNVFYTDKAGKFKIPATDSLINISVSSSGYDTQNFQLINNAITLNQLSLRKNSNNAFSRAVTPNDNAGYTKNREKYRDSTQYPTVMVQQAQPVYGWMAYQQYLEKNKRPPAANPGLTGEVVVSFLVNKKGNLSDFTIEQSLAKGYDEEAIRLIKAGPPWKLAEGRRSRVTVIVRF